jgi:hypothetical protein
MVLWDREEGGPLKGQNDGEFSVNKKGKKRER